MFEGLGDRIQGVFKELRGEGHLTEYHLESALRQIRLSLLEADVALPVVKDFTERVNPHHDHRNVIAAPIFQRHVDQSLRFAEESPEPDSGELYTDIYA